MIDDKLKMLSSKCKDTKTKFYSYNEISYDLGNYVERPRQGVGSFMVAASVVSAASNLAGKSTKKRRAPPPPSTNPRGRRT